MSVALLLISDGREDFLAQSRESIETSLPSFDYVVHVDDAAHELGFAGAIRDGWERVRATGADWVWHAEQDFTYNQPVPLDRMIALLERQPHLAQIALKRQPWNHAEAVAGGVVELHPGDFTDHDDGLAVWAEHRRFFTTNPSVYSARLCLAGWPQERYSEGLFTRKLLTDPLLRFAYWGGKFDPPLVTHIGTTRDGFGY